jgi:hypothetical protein
MPGALFEYEVTIKATRSNHCGAWSRGVETGVTCANRKCAYRLPFHFRGPSLNSW